MLGTAQGRLKGSISSESTMQISGHFVCQATTELWIYAKSGRTLVHTDALSEHSHARMVTPNGWPLSALRWLGQTFPSFRQTRKHTKCGTHQLSEVKHGKKKFSSSGQKSEENKPDVGKLFIPAEVKNTRLALLNFLSQRPPLKIWR